MIFHGAGYSLIIPSAFASVDVLFIFYIANYMDPDQTAPFGAVWSGSIQFVAMIKEVWSASLEYMLQKYM